MKKSSRLGAVCAYILLMCISSSAVSAVIDTFFGWNLGVNSANSEVQLIDIKYIGDGGGVFTTAMPAFSDYTCTSDVVSGPCTGMPDDNSTFANNPSYTTGGDGETTRTIGQAVPINWDTSGAFPTIDIFEITAITVGATWTGTILVSDEYYTVGLIPGSSGNTELDSLLASPQGDIYDGLAGAAGNVFSGSFIATAVSNPIYKGQIGSAFGEIIFSAAVSPIPLPPAVWLFGSGLLGVIGIARRKNTA